MGARTGMQPQGRGSHGAAAPPCSDSPGGPRPGRGGRRLHPARVRQERLSGREGKRHPHPRRGHTWALQAGSGEPGRRLAPASLGRLPAPPRGGRQMGRPPAQRRRQETAGRGCQECARGGGSAATPPGRSRRRRAWARSRPGAAAACGQGSPGGGGRLASRPLRVPACAAGLRELGVSFPSVLGFHVPLRGWPRVVNPRRPSLGFPPEGLAGADAFTGPGVPAHEQASSSSVLLTWHTGRSCGKWDSAHGGRTWCACR